MSATPGSIPDRRAGSPWVSPRPAARAVTERKRGHHSSTRQGLHDVSHRAPAIEVGILANLQSPRSEMMTSRRAARPALTHCSNTCGEAFTRAASGPDIDKHPTIKTESANRRTFLRAFPHQATSRAPEFALPRAALSLHPCARSWPSSSSPTDQHTAVNGPSYSPRIVRRSAPAGAPRESSKSTRVPLAARVEINKNPARAPPPFRPSITHEHSFAADPQILPPPPVVVSCTLPRTHPLQLRAPDRVRQRLRAIRRSAPRLFWQRFFCVDCRSSSPSPVYAGAAPRTAGPRSPISEGPPSVANACTARLPTREL